MRKIRKKNNYFVLLILLVIALGIGYALISTDLTINGVGKFNNQSWNVHFEDLTLNPNNVELSSEDVAATIDQTTMTDITFTVTLQEPGDFYEFEVAAVNSGTMDAMVGLVTNNLNGNPISSTNQVPTFARYIATYSDGIEIAPNHLLEAGYSENYKVRVEYRTDIDSEDLPTTVQTLTFAFGVQYVQRDSNAITKPTSVFESHSWETIVANVHNGDISDYHVGDTKAVELGNNIGTQLLRISNMSTPTSCEIASRSQTACGFVLEFVDVIAFHAINSSSNSGGWEASEMRTYLNDTNDTTSIINSLPLILKNSIIDTKVVSGLSGNTIATVDKLYLLSAGEIWINNSANQEDSISQVDSSYYYTRQLDYYAGLNVTTSDPEGGKKLYKGSVREWWLRSTFYRQSRYFFYVNIYGNWGFETDTNIEGVSPAFRIG